MTVLFWVWGLSAVAILAVTAVAGRTVRGTVLGILVDSRGRCSLSRFHTVWWTTIILSLVTAVAAARFSVVGTEVLGFVIPTKVLGLLGVVASTAVASAVVKSYKDNMRAAAISATPIGLESLGQMLTLEEGALADQTLDVGKLQSLLVTVLLGLGYVLTCIHEFLGNDPVKISGPADIATLPDLNATFVALLAISGAHYVGMKTIPRSGSPTLSLTTRNINEADLRATEAASNEPMDSRSVINRRKKAANVTQPSAPAPTLLFPPA